MLSDALWLFIIICFVLAGFTRPYVALAAVIWVDVLRPQDISFGFLAGQSLSLYITLFFLFSFVINISKVKRPHDLKPTYILLFLILWVTICNMYAIAPVLAWFKYDFVVKTLIFCLFIPFVASEKRQLDFLIAIFVSSLSFYILTAGLRTITGSGGYGAQLVFTRGGDSGAAETSTLSMLSVMILPLVFYIIKHSVYHSSPKIVKFALILICFCGLAGMIGTHARTGLIGLIVFVAFYIYHSKYKIKILALLILSIPIVYSVLPSDYLSRMNTIKSANSESSALGRIIVWKWTLDFVQTRPFLGGGFNSFVANAGELKQYIPEGVWIDEKEDSGKAYHSIYFESLGETGYIGLIAYLYMLFLIWRSNVKIRNHKPDESLVQLAISLNLCLFIYAACGAFIGIAYAAWIYYLLGFTSCLMTVVYSKKTNEQFDRPLKKHNILG